MVYVVCDVFFSEEQKYFSNFCHDKLTNTWIEADVIFLLSSLSVNGAFFNLKRYSLLT